MIVGTKRQNKLTILIFWTKFAQKGYFQPKLETKLWFKTEKGNTTTAFSIFELVYNHSQNILDKLWFSCETTHYGKCSMFIFQEIFASADEIFILGGGLSTRQQFSEVLRLS